MIYLSIVIFFVLMFGIGFSLTYLTRKEAGFMALAYGIVGFTILSCIFAIIRIPIKWHYFLVVSLIVPVYFVWKNWGLIIGNIKIFSFSTIVAYLVNKIKLVHIFLLAIFIFNMWMMLTGSFSYPLYEDGDPYKHSGITKYIALTGSALEPWTGANVLQYIDSYPVGYDVLMSTMFQVSGNLIWTLKFFNSLLICLGIIFFYYFVKEFCQSEKIALYSTIVLSFIPAYASHFIWAITLATLLIFPLFYSLEKKWYILSGLCFSAVLLSQPTHAVVICGLLGIYLIFNYKDWNKTISIFSGGVVSVIVWYGPMYLKYGSLKALLSGAGTTVTNKATEFGFRFVGSGDRIYTFKDYFFASAQNNINQPVGLGIIVTILVLIGIYLVARSKND